MSQKITVQPKGSLILKILIPILMVFLVVSVLYPKQLWKRQDAVIKDSRERMDNINYIVQRYHDVTGTYIANLDSLLDFMEHDSIQVKRAAFEFDRLSLYDAPNDSFLIGFPDLYHFDHMKIEGFSQGQPVPDPAQLAEGQVVDSIVVSLMPKPYFQGVIDPVQVAMTSGKGINYEERHKGEADIYWTIWSPGKLERTYLSYDGRMVPSKKYLLYRPLEDLRIDPISNKPYELVLNAKITLDGTIIYTMVAKGEPDPMVYGDELHTNLFINKLARQAKANVDQALKTDSTLYNKQLEMQGQYFDVSIEMMKPGRETKIEANKETDVPVDSVDLYRDPNRIRLELFKLQYDSLIRVWSKEPATIDLLKKMTYKEDLKLSKVVTVGVTIEPPFGRSFKMPNRDILDAIFSVGPVKNPGDIVNNDLSWEEKR